MLQRKFTTDLSRFLQEEPDKIMLVNGARQIGKSYLIRYVSQQLFANYIEINLQEDKEGARIAFTQTRDVVIDGRTIHIVSVLEWLTMDSF